jgi:uncharacterized membrane protein YgcG
LIFISQTGNDLWGGSIIKIIRFGNSYLNERHCITYYPASTRKCLRLAATKFSVLHDRLITLVFVFGNLQVAIVVTLLAFGWKLVYAGGHHGGGHALSFAHFHGPVVGPDKQVVVSDNGHGGGGHGGHGGGHGGGGHGGGGHGGGGHGGGGVSVDFVVLELFKSKQFHKIFQQVT